MLKEPEEEPAAIKMPTGIEATPALLDKRTVAPPAGATALSVTVHALVLPPMTGEGPHAIEETGGPDDTRMVPAVAATF